MALTRDFTETIFERAKRDKTFRSGMLMRGIALIVAGDKDDVQTGKSFLRDYINATIGFAALSKSTCIPKASLIRMLGPSGNPGLNNLNQVTRTLLDSEGAQGADSLKILVQS